MLKLVLWLSIRRLLTEVRSTLLLPRIASFAVPIDPVISPVEDERSMLMSPEIDAQVVAVFAMSVSRRERKSHTVAFYNDSCSAHVSLWPPRMSMIPCKSSARLVLTVYPSASRENLDAT